MLDQDALNILLTDDVTYLPLEWNVQMHNFVNGEDIVANADRCYDAFVNPKVIHYTGPTKPWNSSFKYSDYFWKYAKKTLFYNDMKTISSSSINYKDNN